MEVQTSCHAVIVIIFHFTHRSLKAISEAHERCKDLKYNNCEHTTVSETAYKYNIKTVHSQEKELVHDE